MKRLSLEIGILVVLSLWGNHTALAQEAFYYGKKSRSLEVYSDGHTLMIFPSPPYARVCQPANVVDIVPVQNMQELNDFLVPRGMEYGTLPMAEEAKSALKEEDRLAYILKLVPMKKYGSAQCSITLANRDIVQVKFKLGKDVFRPIVSFENVLTRSVSDQQVTRVLGGSEMLRAFVMGEKLSFLADVTPTRDQGKKYSERTKGAYYTLTYLGTDSSQFKAWIFEGHARRDLSIPKIGKLELGQIRFSAAMPSLSKKGADKSLVSIRPKKGDKFKLYVLTSADVSREELMGRLP